MSLKADASSATLRWNPLIGLYGLNRRFERLNTRYQGINDGLDLLGREAMIPRFVVVTCVVDIERVFDIDRHVAKALINYVLFIDLQAKRSWLVVLNAMSNGLLNTSQCFSIVSFDS